MKQHREMYLMHFGNLNGEEVQTEGTYAYVWLIHFAMR